LGFSEQVHSMHRHQKTPGPGSIKSVSTVMTIS
jgi:hypothetical protein